MQQRYEGISLPSQPEACLVRGLSYQQLGIAWYEKCVSWKPNAGWSFFVFSFRHWLAMLIIFDQCDLFYIWNPHWTSGETHWNEHRTKRVAPFSIWVNRQVKLLLWGPLCVRWILLQVVGNLSRNFSLGFALTIKVHHARLENTEDVALS